MSATPLHLLSGGAAQGLAERLQAGIAALGLELHATFGAVGAMKDLLLAGQACDVFISTEAMLRDLAAQGRLDAASIRPLGMVATGVATQAGRAALPVATADQLREALLGAAEVHCPDTVKSTAGIHFAKVLQQLGVAEALAPRLRTHPNGMTAMRALAASAEASALGCTQITEIRHTPGVQYAGDLPPGLELATVYAAGRVAVTAVAARADALVALFTGPQTAAVRSAAGFAG